MNNKDLLVIAICTLLTVVVWIAADSYHAWVTSTVPSSLIRAIEPLSPRLDTTVIKTLRERGAVAKAPAFSPSETISPTEQTASPSGEIPSPVATVSSTLTPKLSVTPSASPSGTL